MKWRFYIESDYPTVETLVENPIGWADAVFNFKRDIDLHGVFFEYNANLRFYGDGYDLIKAEYESAGVEGSLRIIVKYQCADGDEYSEFFAAKMNFAKIRFEEAEACTVEVVLEDDSCLSLFKNRQDQEVDLSSLESLDGVALSAYTNLNRNISLPSKTILKTDKWLYQEDSGTGDLEQATRTDAGAGVIEFEPYLWTKMTDVINELGSINEEYEAGDSDDENDIPPLWIAPVVAGVPIPAWNLRLKAKATINVSGTKLNLDLPLCGGSDIIEDITITLTLRKKNAGIYAYHTLTTYTNTACDDVVSQAFDVNYDTTFPWSVVAGDEISMYWRVQTSGDYDRIVPLDPSLLTINFSVQDDTESFFEVTLETNYSTTKADVNLVNEALSRCVESITNDCIRVRSNYFGRTDSQPYTASSDGCGALECVTTGLMIRRNTDATQRISFKTLYEGLNAIHNLGVGIEDDSSRAGHEQVRIEEARYFYDDEVILSCLKVPAIRRTAITEEYYSIFEFGYQKWEAESFNGLDEFCTTRKYRTTLTQVKNTLSRISSLIASGYAIEVTRQQFTGLTKDWRYDNDNFVICLKRSGGDLIVELGIIEDPANLIDPDTVYNFRISPRRNGFRWANKIFASYVNAEVAGSFLYMTGTGNTEAFGWINDTCQFEGITIASESIAEITHTILPRPEDCIPLYKPELWEFDYPLSVADYLTVRANPRGVIRVRHGNSSVIRDCYIREIAYRPNQGIATFALLPKYPGVGETGYILTESEIIITTEDGEGLIVE